MLDIPTFLRLFVLIGCFTINPYLKKYTTSDLSREESLLFGQVLNFGMLYFYLFWMYKNISIWTIIPKLTITGMSNKILGSSVTMLGSIVFYDLIKSNDVVFLMPNIQPLVLVSSSMVGYFIYQEPLSGYKKIGLCFIVLGNVWINVVDYYEKVKSD